MPPTNTVDRLVEWTIIIFERAEQPRSCRIISIGDLHKRERLNSDCNPLSEAHAKRKAGHIARPFHFENPPAILAYRMAE